MTICRRSLPTSRDWTLVEWDHSAALHHERDGVQTADILERIAFHCDQVRLEAGTNSAEPILHAQYFCIIDGGRSNRIGCRHTTGDVKLDFSRGRVRIVTTAGVAADAESNARSPCATWICHRGLCPALQRLRRQATG